MALTGRKKMLFMVSPLETDLQRQIGAALTPGVQYGDLAEIDVSGCNRHIARREIGHEYVFPCLLVDVDIEVLRFLAIFSADRPLPIQQIRHRSLEQCFIAITTIPT